MKPLEILTFAKYAPEDVRAGGGEITLWNTIRGLADRGHKVHVVACKSGGKLPEVPNVEYYPTSAFRNMRPIDFATTINWALKTRKIKADVIHGFYAESVLPNIL
ncbi:MAG: glycosyltransferase family 4 protein, partial [Candidatus Altiarchaeota archaeon]